MTDQTVRYQSFLLRLWCDRQSPHTVWRSTVVETLTGEETTFTDLTDLIAFLQASSAQEQEQLGKQE